MKPSKLREPSLAQLAQHRRLDLANTFARDGEQFADLFEGAYQKLRKLRKVEGFEIHRQHVAGIGSSKGRARASPDSVNLWRTEPTCRFSKPRLHRGSRRSEPSSPS
jgi:hypothetical protein